MSALCHTLLNRNIVNNYITDLRKIQLEPKKLPVGGGRIIVDSFFTKLPGKNPVCATADARESPSHLTLTCTYVT